MKPYLKKFTFLLMFFILFFYNITYLFANLNNIKRKRVKIYIVNSYNPFHPCTVPQENGFLSYLRYNNNNYFFDIKTSYLQTKIKNILLSQINYAVNKIINDIYLFDPDVIYITDDNACNYIGITLSYKYFVVCSGLNQDPLKYITQYSLNNKFNKIVFIKEQINFNILWKLLNKSHLFFNKIYLLIEERKEMSATTFFLLQSYIHNLEQHAKIEIYEISNVGELITTIKKLNQKETGIIIPLIQRIKDEYNIYRDKIYINNIILHYNKKHLEIDFNKYFCKYGMSICITPGFENMGNMGAKIVLKYLNKNFEPSEYLKVISLPTKIFVNKQRLYDLNYENILNNIECIDGIYDEIK